MWHTRRALALLTLLYVVMIVYGSLYPFTGWRAALEPRFAFLTDPPPYQISSADLLTNILAYLPLGALLVWNLGTRSRILAVLGAVLAGGVLSFSMESVQMFLPSRVSSNIDLSANIAGTVLGAILGLVFRPTSEIGVRLTSIRDRWFVSGPGAGVATAALALWISSQLSPFVPSMDVSSIAEGLAPLWRHEAGFSLSKSGSYALNIAGIGLMTAVIGKPGRSVRSAFVLCILLVLAIKPFIVTRQLSLESLFGLALSALVLAVVPKVKPMQAALAMLFIFSGFALAELTPQMGSFHAFNWIPFEGELDDTVGGIGSILEGMWPFVALAALAMLGFGTKRRPMLWIGGALLILVFALEWMQQGILGRYGDITAVILAAIGWTAPWLFVSVRGELPVSDRPRTLRRRAANIR